MSTRQIMWFKLPYKNQKGIVLVAAIMMIVVATIAILGVTTFTLERSKYSQARIDSINAGYVAQAGIQWAIYQYRLHKLTANGYYSLGQQTVNGHTFTLTGTGTSAELLMVNTSVSALHNNKKWIIDFQLQNATNSNTITIDKIHLTWDSVATLKEIRINNINLWSGNSISGVTNDISPNFVLDSIPSIYSFNNQLKFSGDMTGVKINIQLIMLDGSSTKLMQIYPPINNFNFIVRSKGQSSNNSIIYKTFTAEYNALTSKVVDYDEMN